jgi:hypothetical protein
MFRGRQGPTSMSNPTWTQLIRTHKKDLSEIYIYAAHMFNVDDARGAALPNASTESALIIALARCRSSRALSAATVGLQNEVSSCSV